MTNERLEIVIGDRAWSSWSLRPWLALKRTGAPFRETAVRLRRDAESLEAIRAHSPSGLVPVLKDGDLVVWDSLAICEHLAERFPAAALWPADPALRSLARSATAEMHAGFTALRREHPMDLSLRTVVPPSSEVRADLARLDALWTDLLARSGGPFLCGDWTIADAFYTPVATRIRSYGLPLDEASTAYAERLLRTPEFLEWEAGIG